MDVTERNLARLNAINATSACNLDVMFVGPTTSAPLAIFQTITFPTTTTTTQPKAAVILGGKFLFVSLLFIPPERAAVVYLLRTCRLQQTSISTRFISVRFTKVRLHQSQLTLTIS